MVCDNCDRLFHYDCLGLHAIYQLDFGPVINVNIGSFNQVNSKIAPSAKFDQLQYLVL